MPNLVYCHPCQIRLGLLEPKLGVDVLRKSNDWAPESLAKALDVDIKAILKEQTDTDRRRSEGSFRRVIDAIGYQAGWLALRGDADTLLNLSVALVDIHHRNSLPRLQDLKPDERAGAYIEAYIGRLGNLQSAVEMKAKQGKNEHA